MDSVQWLVFALTIFSAGLIQGISGFGSALVAINHGFNGNLTPSVWRLFLLALLALGWGIWIGLKVEHRLPQDAFRKAVLLLLLVLGLRLML